MNMKVAERAKRKRDREHAGVLDTRGRRDFSRFDPSPREAAL